MCRLNVFTWNTRHSIHLMAMATEAKQKYPTEKKEGKKMNESVFGCGRTYHVHAHVRWGYHVNGNSWLLNQYTQPDE